MKHRKSDCEKLEPKSLSHAASHSAQTPTEEQLTQRKLLSCPENKEEDPGDKEILLDCSDTIEADKERVTQAPLQLFIELDSREETFQSIAESVESKEVQPIRFETSKRNASFCSRLTLSYARTLVESVKLNKGKLANVMIEDMNSDPGRDEKLQTKFQERLQANYEKWRKNHPSGMASGSSEWYKFTKSAIKSTIGCHFIGTAILALLAEGSTLLSIVMIRFMAQYLAKPENNTKEAVVLVTIFCTATIVASLVRNFYYFHGFTMALETRKLLIQAIFDKVGRLSMRSLSQTNSSRLINTAISDVFNIEKHLSVAPFCLASPLINAACYGIIWNIAGWPCAASILASWIIIFFMMKCLSKSAQKVQKAQARENTIRMKLVNDMILGIQTIKAYALENSYVERVIRQRSLHESKVLGQNILNNLSFSVFQNMGLVAVLCIFLPLWSRGEKLDLGDSFTLLALIYYLFFSVNSMTLFAFNNAIRFFTTIEKISKILCLEEISPRRQFESGSPDQPIVQITDGEYSWGYSKVSQIGQSHQVMPHQRSELETSKTPPLVLHGINLTLLPADLLLVVGKPGSGKSSLLYSLMGETVRNGGSDEVKGRIAHVDKATFIFPGTVKENICFGLEFAECRFRKAAMAALLDGEFPEKGWNTVIGERDGSATSIISTSQKIRIGLARALYSGADIFLIDDALAGLDPPLARTIFNETIKKILANKIVIFVTSQVEFLPQSPKILVLRNGQQSLLGTLDEIRKNDFEIEEILRKPKGPVQKAAVQKAEQIKAKKEQLQLQLIQQMTTKRSQNDSVVVDLSRKASQETTQEKKEEQDLAEEAKQRKMQRHRMRSIKLLRQRTTALAQEELADSSQSSTQAFCSHTCEFQRRMRTDVCVIKPPQKGEDEVKWKDFRFFFTFSYGICGLVTLLIISVLTALLQLAPSIWLAVWLSRDLDEQQEAFYPIVFVSLISTYIFLSFLRTLTIVKIILKGATNLHNAMIRSLLRVSIPFFDQTTISHIVSRFSNDLIIFDLIMPLLWVITVQGFFRALIVAIAIAVIIPWSIIVTVTLSIVTYFTVVLGTRALIESQRLDARARAPINNTLALLVEGLVPMRVAGKIDFFRKDFQNKLRFSTNATFCYVVANRWMGIRLDTLCAIFICFVSIFLVTLKGTVDSSLLIMSLQVAIDTVFLFSLSFRMYAEIENNMGSVQRMVAYTKLESEDDLEKAADKELVQQNWPTQGKVEFQDVTLRYRCELEPSLSNLSFEVQPGMLVGIVGWQGSGKSSIHQALLRTLELQGGRTLIDGVDIKTIGLHLLRNSIAFIPQNPFCVKGTIRENLDPFNEGTTAQIEAVLREINMYEKVYSLQQNINTCISEDNNLFTCGQKQLLCLARAIIRKMKVLVIEQAEQNADLEIDNLIQKTIRERFKNCTVFIIAHRLTSIIDADRVLVLNEGQRQEYSHPYKLLVEHEGDPTITNITGQLARLAISTGIENAHTLFELAEQSYKRENRFYEPLKNSLTVTDNRTGKSYELKIIDNAIAATQLLQIKNVSGGVTRSFDPAFMNTVSCVSHISYIDGDKGVLEYRGIPIDQLAQRSYFTETAFLLIYGQLASRQQQLSFESRIRSNYKMNRKLSGFIKTYQQEELEKSHPMGMLQTLISCLSSCYPEANPAYQSCGQPIYATQVERDVHIHRLLGQVPAIAAACLRVYQGLPLVEPNMNLGYVHNFLQMAFGPDDELAKNPKIVHALETLFILHAEHELNCSTAAVRHMTSSHADVYTSLSGAVTALYGPRHGGANEAVLKMLEEIKTVDRVPAFIQKVKSKERVLMGFGHRVYKNYDPRASIVKQLAQEVFQITGKEELIDVALELERVALTDKYFIQRKLYPNVDFYSGVIYKAMGFPVEYFTVLFALPRFSGWLSHWNEFIQDPDNKIVRPRQIYRGERQRNFVPVSQRKEDDLAKYSIPGGDKTNNTLLRLPTIMSQDASYGTDVSQEEQTIDRRLLRSTILRKSTKLEMETGNSMIEGDIRARMTPGMENENARMTAGIEIEKNDSSTHSSDEEENAAIHRNIKLRPSSKFAMKSSQAGIIQDDSTQNQDGLSDDGMKEMMIEIEDQQKKIFTTVAREKQPRIPLSREASSSKLSRREQSLKQSQGSPLQDISPAQLVILQNQISAAQFPIGTMETSMLSIPDEVSN